ncbi:MAG TPA: GTPase domain-containing protein [Acidobacteriota bacterium]|nr:GTPase domain-containing protein [Acidobacteriota bacterium]
MAFVNYATKNLAIKIVYYGPGLSGKTTNLRFIYFKLDASYRGDFICLETDTERTFFFDLLPIKAGLIGEFKVHFQLMTVPGQAFYEASRKSVLKGADGIVFVADSQIPLLDANLENFDGLRRNCLEHNIDLNQIPLVFQYNKRDLNYLIPVETFNNLLNPRRLPFVEAAAINGVGVFESLREISKLTVPVVREKVFGEKRKEIRKAEFPEEHPERPKEDVEFITPSQASPFEVTKIKMKSQKEIEQELDKISKEFGTKAK